MLLFLLMSLSLTIIINDKRLIYRLCRTTRLSIIMAQWNPCLTWSWAPIALSSFRLFRGSNDLPINSRLGNAKNSKSKQMYNSIIKTLKIRFYYNTCCCWKPSTRVHQKMRFYFTSYNYQILKTYFSNKSLPIEHFILSLFQFINKYFIIQNFD